MSDNGYKFCPKCGQELPKEMNYCTSCGFKQPDTDSNNKVEENKVNNQSSPLPDPEHQNMIKALKSLWNNIFFIGGRATRAEFWYGYLDLAIINFISFFIWGMMLSFDGPAKVLINIIISVIFAFTSIAYFTSSIRRLHDTNKKGRFLWLLLIPLIGPILIIVFLAMDKVDDNNRFNNKLQKPWHKEIWTWLVIFLVAFCSFGFFNSYTKAMENYSYNNVESSNSSNSNDDYDDSDDDNESEDSSDNDSDSSDEDDSPEVVHHTNLTNFNIGPLEFTDVTANIIEEKDMSDESANDFSQTFAKTPEDFYEEGQNYQQIVLYYKIKNTGSEKINFEGLMDSNDLILPDGTQINQLENDEFYSYDKPSNSTINPGSKIKGYTAIQLTDSSKSKIPSGQYQFTTAEANGPDFDTVGKSIDLQFSFK